MKSILFLACVAALVATTGCIFPGPRGREYHERGEHHGHVEYREQPVYVRPPEPTVDIHIHAE